MSYCTRMSSPQDEIEALTKQVASLTARVFALEQQLGAPSPVFLEPPPSEQSQTPPLIPSEAISEETPKSPVVHAPTVPAPLPSALAFRPAPRAPRPPSPPARSSA